MTTATPNADTVTTHIALRGGSSPHAPGLVPVPEHPFTVLRVDHCGDTILVQTDNPSGAPTVFRLPAARNDWVRTYDMVTIQAPLRVGAVGADAWVLTGEIDAATGYPIIAADFLAPRGRAAVERAAAALGFDADAYLAGLAADRAADRAELGR